MPHIVRTGLSECLGLDHAQSASSRPMSAAASATRASCLPRRSALGWLAMHCGHPVRWIEDRREHLTANANCREHHYIITGYADRDGRCSASIARRPSIPAPIRPIRSRPAWKRRRSPASCPVPTIFPPIAAAPMSVATNKCPILPYRGVARTGVCFAMELMLDAIAREVGIEPHEVRLRNLVRPEQMPFDNITNKHFDSGDYPRVPAPRRRRDRCRRRPAATDAGRGRRPPHRRRACALLRAGRARHLGLFRLGHSDGAGLRAGDRAADPRWRAGTARRRPFPRPEPGDDARPGRPRNPRHRHRHRSGSCIGDTAMTPYSTGTWGSRCMVMAGGAVADRLQGARRSRIARIGGQLLQTDADNVACASGAGGRPQRRDQPRRYRAHLVPAPAGPAERRRSRRAGSRPSATSRSATPAPSAMPRMRRWSRSTPRSATSRSSTTSIVEDGGKLINPMVVDGQISAASRRASAPRSTRRCPSTPPASRSPPPSPITCCRAPTEVPATRLDHMETPSPYTQFGVKGHRRGRRHRAAGGDRQRRQRCARDRSAPKLLMSADDAAPRAAGDRRRRREPRHEAGRLRL